MKQFRQPSEFNDQEATLVAPRFDDEETTLARPVVPLDAVGGDAPAQAVADAHTYAAAPRRPWVLALVLVSALVGGMLGGAGLYLYQKRQRAQASVEPEQTVIQAEVPRPAAAAPSEPQRETVALTPQPSAPVTAEDRGSEDKAADSSAADDGAAATSKREAEKSPASVTRVVSGDGAPKRGKKGARDAELQRRTSDADGAEERGREARRVDTITYRPRRVSRRTPERSVDRVRGIFEGQPQ